MYILGITSYSHEASASLIKDGQLLSVMEEERFNREKHTSKFPINAIRACLEQANITADDIDHFTFFWQPMQEITGNISHVLKYFPKSMRLFTANSGGEEFTFFARFSLQRKIEQRIQREFKLSQKPKVHFIEHHLCHAASAFNVSKFEEAAILTIDGRGESTSTMIAHGKGNDIKKIKEIRVPHSLGHLYASITDYLGFKPFSDEWKVMGLSAYGTDAYVSKFEKIMDLTDDGGYLLNLEYFDFHTQGQTKWLSDKFYEEFGPAKKYTDEYEQRHYDIAFGLQYIVEQAGLHLAKGVRKLTKAENLCMTGGVVLNCLMNKKIVEEAGFKDYFIQPIANDAGTSFGSAYYLYNNILKQKRDFIFDSIYLGLGFSNEEIEKVLKEKKVKYHRSENIAKETAEHIADNKIVGWFQGRMESGPRALGNRSIVVNPTNPKMKDILNARVKKREFYRPFAPSVIEEAAEDYFIKPGGYDSPYMILIADVKEDKKKTIPAVTHNDGTARFHTVSKEGNNKYWNLINEFGKISGVPVMLNTSFNENEPIVMTPEHAVNCFLRTEFDILSIGDFLVTK